MKYAITKLALAVAATICGPLATMPALAQAVGPESEGPPSLDLIMGPGFDVDELAMVSGGPAGGPPMVAVPIIPGGPMTLGATEDAAAGGAWGGHHGGPPACPVLSSLSDEQVEKLHNLHNQYLDELGPKSIELASKSRKLKDILLANSINESEAKALQSDINKIKDEIANLKLEHHIAMASILTVDQKKEMRESIYRGPLEHMARHHHMGGWEKHPHMSSSLNSEWHGDK